MLDRRAFLMGAGGGTAAAAAAAAGLAQAADGVRLVTRADDGHAGAPPSSPDLVSALSSGRTALAVRSIDRDRHV